MNYKNFLRVGLLLQKNSKELTKLYKLKVDLLDFVDPYNESISILIESIYGKEGCDWWSWYCYENDFGTRGLEAWDENKKRICYSWESLYEYLEKNCKSGLSK